MRASTPAPGAVVLLSGGLDSAVCLHYARREWGVPLLALVLEYGQRHTCERTHAAKIARAAGVEPVHDQIGAQGIGLYTSLRRGAGDVSSRRSDGRLSVVVEGRNAMFLTVAAAYAKAKRIHRVVIGCSADDHAEFPDCRGLFLSRMRDALALGLEWPLRIEAPLIARTKADTIRLARELGDKAWAAVGMSWSCYDPQRSGPRCSDLVPCGKCPACIQRINGFQEAGEEDPYADRDRPSLHLRSGALPTKSARDSQVQELARTHLPIVPEDTGAGE